MDLSLCKTKVAVDDGNENGYLVFFREHLTAVFVLLEAEFHGEHRGCWNLEAGFGPCDVGGCRPFPLLVDALVWVALRVGAPTSCAAEAARSVPHMTH